MKELYFIIVLICGSELFLCFNYVICVLTSKDERIKSMTLVEAVCYIEKLYLLQLPTKKSRQVRKAYNIPELKIYVYIICLFEYMLLVPALYIFGICIGIKQCVNQ